LGLRKVELSHPRLARAQSKASVHRRAVSAGNSLAPHQESGRNASVARRCFRLCHRLNCVEVWWGNKVWI